MHRTTWIRIIGLGCVTLLALSPVALAKFQTPAYQGYVNDNANILSDSTEQKLDSIAKELDAKTHTQFAILTIPSLEGTPIESAGLSVARSWGVGHKDKKSSKNSRGLLILIAANDRKMRTEVGYGLEGIIPDGASGEIQRQAMRPYFKQGDYDTGVLEGTKAYAQLVAKEDNVTLDSLNGAVSDTPMTRRHSNAASEENIGGPLGFLLFLIGFLLSGPGIIVLFIVMFLFSMFGPKRYRNNHWDGPFYMGGGFGGGSFGGGGSSDWGGFGGGDFGGGGSSSDW